MGKPKLMGLLVSFMFLFQPMMASAIEVGQKAPDFELRSTEGGKLTLSSFRGKRNVLIEFYVLDFTPG